MSDSGEIEADPPGGIPPPNRAAVRKTVEELSREIRGLSHKERARVLGQFGRKDEKPQTVAISQMFAASVWQGPLPSPESLARFNQVVPGAAERMIRMAEKQQDHRMALETKVSTEQISQSARGQYFALLISLAILVVGTFAIYSGYPGSGATIVTSTIIGMAYVFITGKRHEQSSRNQKREEIERSEAAQAAQTPPDPGPEV